MIAVLHAVESPMVWAAVFWSCVVLIGYSYVGYPLLLKWSGSKLRVPTARVEGGPSEPVRLSIIFAAYNEARVIEEKLRSIVDSDYPKERLEVWVGDDASSDATAQIVREFSRNHAFIQLVSFTARTGKPAIVNRLAERSTGEVLVMTDANVMFAPDCLRRLASHFADPAVRLVAANVLGRRIQADGGVSVQEAAYLQREISIKCGQAAMSGVVIAPFGAAYALRRGNFSPVPAGFSVDDFYIAMYALQDGGRAIQEMEAICFEEVSGCPTQEFRRKVRMSRGNFQNLAVFWKVAVRLWRPIGFHFVSHKVLRWLTPGLLLASLLACGLLARTESLYRLALVGMGLGLLMPLLDRPLRKAGWHLRPVRYAAYFLEMNAALAVGFLQWGLGQRGGIWQPTKRAP